MRLHISGSLCVSGTWYYLVASCSAFGNRVAPLSLLVRGSHAAGKITSPPAGYNLVIYLSIGGFGKFVRLHLCIGYVDQFPFDFL